jgi:hypothetical protein
MKSMKKQNLFDGVSEMITRRSKGGEVECLVDGFLAADISSEKRLMVLGRVIQKTKKANVIGQFLLGRLLEQVIQRIGENIYGKYSNL